MNEENTGWLGTGLCDKDVTMVIVKAKSKRGKQLIQRLGNRWWLCRIDENLPCFDGATGVLIAPMGLGWHHAASRWVRATDWLKWDDKDLRPAESSILEHADMAPFVPSGT